MASPRPVFKHLNHDVASPTHCLLYGVMLGTPTAKLSPVCGEMCNPEMCSFHACMYIPWWWVCHILISCYDVFAHLQCWSSLVMLTEWLQSVEFFLSLTHIYCTCVNVSMECKYLFYYYTLMFCVHWKFTQIWMCIYGKVYHNTKVY